MAKIPCCSVDKNWQAECDLRTLKSAVEIQASRTRLAAAKRFASQEQQALQRVTGGANASKPSKPRSKK